MRRHFFDGPLGNKNELWAKSHVKAVEMELSVLLLICSLRGVRGGTVETCTNITCDVYLDYLRECVRIAT